MASRAPIDFQEPVAQPLNLRPALRPQPQTGFMENFSATRREQEIAGNTNATINRLAEQYGPIIDELERSGARFGQGQRFLNPASLPDESTAAYGVGVPGRAEMRRLIHAEIVRRRQANPEFLRDVPDTPEEYDRRINERYAAELRDVRQTQGQATTWGSVGGFIGGVAGAFEDPVNLATMPIGGASRTVLGAIGRSFVENAIIEAASQPLVQRNYADLGEDQTFMDAARSVLFSGGAGAAFRGGAEVIGRSGPIYDTLASSVFNAMPPSIQRRWADAATVDDRLLVDIFRASVPGDRWTPDLRGAVNILERDAEIREASPFEPSPVGDQAHADALTGALRQIAGGVAPRAADPVALAARPPQVRSATTSEQGPSAVGAELRAGGMPEPVVAGFLGNFEVEGGYRGAVGDGGTAFGIAQWRHERVANFQRIIGVHPSRASHGQQARFVRWEMENPQAAGMTQAQRDAILAARTPEEAARLIDRYYERSNGQHRERRAEAARRHAGEGGGDQTEARVVTPLDPDDIVATMPAIRADLFDTPEARVEAQRAMASSTTGEIVEFEPARFAAEAGEVLAADPAIRTERLAETLQITPDEARQVRALAESAEEVPTIANRAQGDLPPAQGASFRKWIEEALGTRDWVVAARLGPKMAERYDVAVPPARFRELEATWRAENDNAAVGSVATRIEEPRADQLSRIIARAEAGGYGKRSRAVQNKAQGELREIEAREAVIADIRAGADTRELQQFDDPRKGAAIQTESIEHDIRAALAENPTLAARKFVTEELGEASLDEILKDLDGNRAFVTAMRACL